MIQTGRLVALALLTLLCLQSSAEAREKTRVTLRGRETVEGRVFDSGTEMLEVVLRRGSRMIHKGNVERWIHVDGVETGPVRPVLLLRSGHEITGNVQFSAERGEYVVSKDIGEIRYPEAEVSRLINPDGTCADGSFSPRRGFKDRVLEAIRKTRSDSAAMQEAGVEYLKHCGFFATVELERALSAGKGDAGKGADPGGRLHALLMRQRVLAAVPPKVENSVPDFVASLMSGDEEDRLQTLQNSFVALGSKLFPLLQVLLLDPSQPASVRGFCVDILQRLNRITELVEAYQKAEGQAQLAVAIALGDAGIYVGVPTLIEALGVEDAAVRRVASAKLEEYTGERFGYDPANPDTVKTAVASWQDWWRTHRDGVEAHLNDHLDPEAKSGARARATGLWRSGNQAWDDHEIQKATDLFRIALEEDPTFLPPFLCLGIIAYQEEARFKEAQEWFVRAIKRAPREGEESVLRLVYYHLGRVHLKSLDTERARKAFLRAIALDPYYADAWYDLGGAVYDEAFLGKDARERRERFVEAAKTFEKGLEKLQEYRNGLVILTKSNLPVGTDLPFSPREHNRSLKALKDHMMKVETRFAYRIAQARFALNEMEEALKWATTAVEGGYPRVDDHLLLATIYSALGRDSDAKRERDRARQLDPRDPRFKDK